MSIGRTLSYVAVAAGFFVGGMGFEHSMHRQMPWDENLVSINCVNYLDEKVARGVGIYPLGDNDEVRLYVMAPWDGVTRNFPEDTHIDIDRTDQPLGCFVRGYTREVDHWWE